MENGEKREATAKATLAGIYEELFSRRLYKAYIDWLVAGKPHKR